MAFQKSFDLVVIGLVAKFDFNDELDDILANISEIEVSKNHQGKNLIMKWDNIVEKLEMYLEEENSSEKIEE